MEETVNGHAKKVHQKAKGVGGWIGVITGVYALAAVVGAPIPQPAWSSDISNIQSDFDELRGDVLISTLRQIRHEKYILERDITKLQEEGKPVPDYMRRMMDDMLDQERLTKKKIELLELEEKKNGTN